MLLHKVLCNSSTEWIYDKISARINHVSAASSLWAHADLGKSFYLFFTSNPKPLVQHIYLKISAILFLPFLYGTVSTTLLPYSVFSPLWCSVFSLLQLYWPSKIKQNTNFWQENIDTSWSCQRSANTAVPSLLTTITTTVTAQTSEDYHLQKKDMGTTSYQLLLA